ncbi:Hypothetical_protein [Hexamita inflata]|uniref:Hypothetical_protein n=1 Tax=Hexamita inflata TaxID=28002 RepID=A0AA86NEI4_9EUKA|nr:Hypothetical protein HINF_LOCUS5917 [Hexamita inflata]
MNRQMGQSSRLRLFIFIRCCLEQNENKHNCSQMQVKWLSDQRATYLLVSNSFHELQDTISFLAQQTVLKTICKAHIRDYNTFQPPCWDFRKRPEAPLKIKWDNMTLNGLEWLFS